MAKTRESRYRAVLQQNSGAEFVKVDLHVHTPASGDAQGKNRYKFKFDRSNFREHMKEARALAKRIVERCIELKIRLIAVTDHNTPSNVHPEELGHTWYELLRDAAKKEDEGLCILPGVEISTDDLHILVILDPGDDPAAFTIHRINALLGDCGFTLGEYGNYRATGMSSLFDVLQYIEELGTGCIAMPAHIDGGSKAMLSVYGGPSNVFRKLLNHPNLNAVEVVKDTTPTRKKIGSGRKAPLLGDYFASQRDSHRSPLAWIQNSDGHSIKDDGLGKRFTWVRMGRPSFSALKNAQEDPETRVRLAKDLKPDNDKTSIVGMAFRKGPGDVGYLAFNQNLNCIVGRKRTNKSTVVDLVLYGLDRFSESEKAELEQGLIKKKYSVDVFVGKGDDVFCASRDKDGSAPKWFRLKAGSFSPLAERPDLQLPRRYSHEGIEGRFSKKTELMDFIDWGILRNFRGMTAALAKRDKCLEAVKEESFKNCKAKLKSLKSACRAVFKKRSGIKGLRTKKSGGNIDIWLSQYAQKDGEALFKVRVKKGKYTGTREENYFDKATPYVLDGAKYTELSRLRTGMKNAAIMALLMNQDTFGPLIVDEPEQYMDVSGITGILVPRMRELKTEQQIICVTKDEHILLSGDAEHVIAMQSEKDIVVIAGDTNDRRIQEQILEIFEGDAEGRELLKKRRKLAGILGE